MQQYSNVLAFFAPVALLMACSGGSGQQQPDSGIGQPDSGFTHEFGNIGPNQILPEVTRGISGPPDRYSVTFTSDLLLGGTISSTPKLTYVDLVIEGIDNDFLFVFSENNFPQVPNFGDGLELEAGSYMLEVKERLGSEGVERYTISLYTGSID